MGLQDKNGKEILPCVYDKILDYDKRCKADIFICCTEEGVQTVLEVVEQRKIQSKI